MVKGDTGNHWAIKWGDAQKGTLQTVFDGARPSKAYSPMKVRVPEIEYAMVVVFLPRQVDKGQTECALSLRSPLPRQKPGALILGLGGDTSPGGVSMRCFVDWACLSFGRDLRCHGLVWRYCFEHTYYLLII